MAASGACIQMLEKLLEDSEVSKSEISFFVADVGPGSFTGVKVAVTLAKTLAFALAAKAGAVSSFDLVSASETVVIPSRKGEWFVRVPGFAAERVNELPSGPYVGFGPGFAEDRFPDAERASQLLSEIQPIVPEALLPNYIAEPSISTPKQPYRELRPGAPIA